jgi:hypothetical protein
VRRLGTARARELIERTPRVSNRLLKRADISSEAPRLTRAEQSERLHERPMPPGDIALAQSACCLLEPTERALDVASIASPRRLLEAGLL